VNAGELKQILKDVPDGAYVCVCDGGAIERAKMAYHVHVFTPYGTFVISSVENP